MTALASPSAVRPTLTLALLSLAHAFNHAQVALLPLVYLAVIPIFRVGVGEIALVVAAANVASGSLQLGYGAFTRLLPRRVLLGLGNVVFGAAMAAMAFASSFLPFAVLNVASRMGGSPQHPVGNALIAEQFPSSRLAFAISAHIAGGNAGTLAVPLVGAAVLVAVGWQGALLVFGLPMILIGLLMTVLIRETSADREAALAHGSVGQAYLSLLRQRDLLLLFASAAIAGGGRGLGVVTTFVPLYLALVLGLEPALVAGMYAVLLAGSVPAPLVAGWLADRVGHKPMLLATYAGGTVALLVLVLAGDSVPLLWLGVVLLAAFNFAESPQLQALLALLVPARTRDVAYSAYFTLAFGLGSLWIAGYGAVIALAGEADGFPVVFGLMAAAFVGAAAIVLPIRPPDRHAIEPVPAAPAPADATG